MQEETLVLDVLLDEGRLKIGVHLRGDVISLFEDIPSSPMARIDKHCRRIVDLQNRIARGGTTKNPEALEKLKVLGQMLADELLTPDAKTFINSANAKHLIIKLDEQLVHIPWELLYLDRQFLCHRFSLGRMVKTRIKMSKPPIRKLTFPYKLWILTFAGDDLSYTASEGLEICHQMDLADQGITQVEASLDTNVSVQKVQENLRAYDFIHFAGHADHNFQAPGVSGWRFADGNLSAEDINKMAGGSAMPAMIFSNACQSARTDSEEWNEKSDDKPFSMAKAFMLAGVKHYIGTSWEIADEPSSYFGISFYTHLHHGRTVGESLRLARTASAEKFDVSTSGWLSYVLYGDPTVSYFEPSGLYLVHEKSIGDHRMPIPFTGELTVGRRESNDVAVDKPMISRQHFVVSRKNSTAELKVMGRNGIKVADEFFRGTMEVHAPLRFDLWGEWFRLEGSSLNEEEKPTEYMY